jgi:exosortase A-associated hydrolase 2
MDFFGTGDSEGHLRDANMKIWRENIMRTLETTVSESDVPVTLWGVRLGALMALDSAATLPADHPVAPIQQLLLWQPVLSGKRFVTQLLRQRVASLVNLGLESETTAEIRQRLQAGEPIEISGYVVREALIAELERLMVPDFTLEKLPNILWLENSETPEDELPASARKAIDELSGRGLEVQVVRFIAPPVWQLHERDQAPDLIKNTLRLFA